MSATTTEAPERGRGLGDRIRFWWKQPAPSPAVGDRGARGARHRAAPRDQATPDHHHGGRLRRHDGAVRDDRAHRHRPQRRGGSDRTARPGLCRLLRRRRLRRRDAHLPGEPCVELLRPRVLLRTVGMARVRPAGDRADGSDRRHPRHTDAAAPGRLPRHRDPRFRRDRPPPRRQPHRRHQRRGGSAERAVPRDRQVGAEPRRRLLVGQQLRDAELRRVVVLAGTRHW